MIKNTWTIDEVRAIYHKPVLQLMVDAAQIHREYNATAEVQVCTLLSVKTGGCSEDCAYCPQAARYNTGVNAHRLMKYEEVIEKAAEAKHNGSTRFCMGAAWRDVKDGTEFDRVI